MNRLKAAVLRQYEDDIDFQIEVKTTTTIQNRNIISPAPGVQSAQHGERATVLSGPKDCQGGGPIGHGGARGWEHVERHSGKIL